MSISIPKTYIAYFLNILSGLMFATSGIFVHYLSDYGFSSMQMVAMRGVVSAVLMTVIVLMQDREKFRTKPCELLSFFASGLFMFLTAYFYYRSMELTSISTAVVLMYTAPVFVMIYSGLFFGETITPLKVTVLLLMIVGAGLVSGMIGGAKWNLLGILFGFLSAIAYSAYNILIKTQMRRKNHPKTAMLYCYLAMGVFSTLGADIPQMSVLTAQNPVRILPLMLGIGIFTCILPYFLYTVSMKTLPAGIASAMGMIDPMAATVYSVVLFREKLDILSIVGILLILGSTVVLGVKEIRE